MNEGLLRGQTCESLSFAELIQLLCVAHERELQLGRSAAKPASPHAAASSSWQESDPASPGHSDIDNAWALKPRKVRRPSDRPMRTRSWTGSLAEPLLKQTVERKTSKESSASRHPSSKEGPDLKLAVAPERKFSARTSSLKYSISARFRGGSWTASLVHSAPFSYCVMLAILVNSIIIGYQANFMAVSGSTNVPGIFLWSEVFFGALFLTELLLRLHADGCKTFYCGVERAWNIFDTILVCNQMVELIVTFCLYAFCSDQDSDMSETSNGFMAFRALRMLRLLRVLRAVRLVHIVGEVHAILTAIVGSMRSLWWTMLLLLLIVYVLGVILTQVVSDHFLIANITIEKERGEALADFFGSVFATTMSLFQAVTDGEEWRNMVEPLQKEISVLFGPLFALYVGFVSFALMNVVTGMFVEKAFHQGKTERRRYLLEQARSVFQVGDGHPRGKVTKAEFERHIQDPLMQAILQAIDLDPDEALELFHLLDLQHEGAVEVEEFINGCLHLEGTAKAIDLEAFSQQQRRYSIEFVRQSDHINQKMSVVSAQLAELMRAMHVEKPEPISPVDSPLHGA